MVKTMANVTFKTKKLDSGYSISLMCNIAGWDIREDITVTDEIYNSDVAMDKSMSIALGRFVDNIISKTNKQ